MRSLLVATAAVALLGLLGGAAVGAPGLLRNKYAVSEDLRICTDSNGDPVGEVVYEGPLKMWPPNHKYQPVSIVATAYDSDDSVHLMTAGTHDEFLEDGTEMNGAGNTDNDVDPWMAEDGFNPQSASTTHQLRSERSGQGDGRTYTLDWQATFRDDDGDGETVICGSEDLGAGPLTGEPDVAFTVEVPHDMRCGADWKGGNKGNGGNGQCAQGQE
jgi:hypothetical protein